MPHAAAAARPHRLIAALLSALLLGVAPATAQTAAPTDTDALLGPWRIDVVAGSSIGDFGEMTIRRNDAGALVADLVFTDTRVNESAEQTCIVDPSGAVIRIRCEVSTPFWLPENFDLQWTGADRLEGPHISATSGQAVFTRPTSDFVS